MSDCSPLRLAENGQSSPSQSLDSQNSPDLPPNSHRIGGAGDQASNRETGGRIRSHSESSSKSGQLRYGAKNVIELFIPVSLCMLIVVATMKATDSYHYSGQSVIWYAQMMFTDQSVDTGTRVWQSLANAFIMMIFIVIMTTVLILLYKFRCYATIHCWLILGSLVLLFYFTLMFIAEILKVYNIPMDSYTLSIFIWNFGVVGMICIHWKGPLLLQQGYLITISAFMALVFIRCLPDWTIWTVLAIMSVWDLIAVLCPRGPLRILVETAQERNEPIFPALIYSSTMVWEIGVGILSTPIVSTMPSISMADTKSSQNNSKKSRRNNRNNNRQNTDGRSQQGAIGASSSRQTRSNAPDPGTPKKRNQHPVEIHYEDGAAPPEVLFIQPTISSSSEVTENWGRPINASTSIRERQPNVQTVGMNSDQQASANEITINLHSQENRIDHQLEEERGVKLGLGDFIFFSVLVGKASSFEDWTITMSCYVSILVGLCLTLSLLAVFRKALPALPISIAFGLCSLFMSYLFVAPFSEKLAIDQVFT